MPILTDEAVTVITEAFNEADADKSGYVDAKELKAFLDKLAESEGFESPSEEDIAARLAEIPTEEPGKLKLEGVLFAVAMLKVIAITVALFAAADSDESGQLETAEVKNVITKCYEMMGEEVPDDETLDKYVAECEPPVSFETFASIAVPAILVAFDVKIE